jgi:hypothetical protein
MQLTQGKQAKDFTYQRRKPTKILTHHRPVNITWTWNILRFSQEPGVGFSWDPEPKSKKDTEIYRILD